MSVLDHAGHNAAIPITEDSALEPQAQRRGAYTQTKLAAENLVRAAIHTEAGVYVRDLSETANLRQE
jgi:nucleoside-diphosphate-sugar epimerase